MSINLNLTQRIEVAEALALNENPEIVTDGFSVVSVALAHGVAELEVDLGALIANLKVLAIKSTAYPETVVGTPDISYKLHDVGGTPILLGNMHMLCGAGLCAILAAEPDILFFTNAHAVTDVTITIFMAQDITP